MRVGQSALMGVLFSTPSPSTKPSTNHDTLNTAIFILPKYACPGPSSHTTLTGPSHGLRPDLFRIPVNLFFSGYQRVQASKDSSLLVYLKSHQPDSSPASQKPQFKSSTNIPLTQFEEVDQNHLSSFPKHPLRYSPSSGSRHQTHALQT
jgi:hypothetical protein